MASVPQQRVWGILLGTLEVQVAACCSGLGEVLLDLSPWTLSDKLPGHALEPFSRNPRRRPCPSQTGFGGSDF